MKEHETFSKGCTTKVVTSVFPCLLKLEKATKAKKKRMEALSSECTFCFSKALQFLKWLSFFKPVVMWSVQDWGRKTQRFLWVLPQHKDREIHLHSQHQFLLNLQEEK